MQEKSNNPIMTKPIKDYKGHFPHLPHPERHMQPNHIQRQSGPLDYDMVVFSHLRWEFVFQRPQHIITRLASARKVLFVEEPIAFSPGEENTANLLHVHENITVLQPRVNNIASIEKILKKQLIEKPQLTAWFYSPAFIPLLDKFRFKTIIYDCMDELSLFRGADPLLIDQEKHLLSKAHIVFTGGKSLYEAKQAVHRNVYCFPSSVEQAHFRKALNGIAVPKDILNLKGTVIGYYGVIDERIDALLLEQMASQNPGDSFVMIGPLAKISRKDLPRKENIHYLGMRSYEVLPNYLKGFDIAMMPFAMNDATKFISPTKTLEYMAAGKPIISTPVYDVVRDYSNHVNIIHDAHEFMEAKKGILEKIQAGTYNPDKYNDILHTTSWDDTVKCMEKLIANIPVPENEQF
jgi:glycosyltransferase involved in cell wall biosynthesis